MAGTVLFDHILDVVRLERLFELSSGYKVFDLLSGWVEDDKQFYRVTERREWWNVWMISEQQLSVIVNDHR